MPEYVRALAYVLIISTPVWFLARRLAEPTIDAAEFTLWRNAWFVTTCVLFLSGNFFIFAAFLGIISIYAFRKSNEPAYLYIVLMFAAPALPVIVGLFGVINKIIDFNPSRLLALVILLPRAIQLARGSSGSTKFSITDKLVVAYCVLLMLLSLRLGKVTDISRMAFIYGLDILLPYFVFSRVLGSVSEIRKALMALVVAAMPLAAAGMFELAKGWRLYNTIADAWGINLIAPYLIRDGILRAAVTSAEPIAFGFVCMVAAGCLLTIRVNRPFGLIGYASLAILLGGLLASVSRGPWLGFALLVLVLLAAHPKGITNVLRGSLALGIFIVPFLMSPYGARFTKYLPFIGTVETGNEDYRVDLFHNAMIVIGRNPLFGSPNFLHEPEMQAMVQGQGIVDVVNTYIGVAIEFGLIALALFVLVFATIGFKLAWLSFTAPRQDIRISGLLGCLAAILVTIATVSSVSIIPYLYWTFAGLCVALLRVGATAESHVEQPEPVARMRVVGRSS